MKNDDEFIQLLEKHLGKKLTANTKAAERRRSAPPSAWRKASAPRVALAEIAPNGYQVRSEEHGDAFKIITPLEDAEGKRLQRELTAACKTADSSFTRRLATNGLDSAQAADILFFDIESCGLAFSPLFLIGTMTIEKETAVIRQFLARSLCEEAAVVALFQQQASEKSLFITFNGKSFDLPTIYRRATEWGVRCVLHAQHFDLLHHARRSWPDLPDCRLATLETEILGHPPRLDDIAGEEVAAAYQAFLHNSNAWPLSFILRHNRQDLLSMAQLVIKLP